MGPNRYKYITVKSNSKVLNGLSSKKYHQIKVRAYKKVSGKTLYGEWSKVNKVKTK